MSETPSLLQLMRRWKDGESVLTLSETYGIPNLERNIRRLYGHLGLPGKVRKNRRATREWTPQEDQLLEQACRLKRQGQLDYLSANLRRTTEACHARARKLGLKWHIRDAHPSWTAEEDEVIRQGAKLTGRKMHAFFAANLNRTTVAWQARARRLKINYGRQRWSKEEEAAWAAGIVPPNRTKMACVSRSYQWKKAADSWTPEEDEALCRAYRERPKNKRSPVLTEIKRHPSACRMRWRQLQSADKYRKRKEAQDLRKQNRRTS